MPERKIRRPDPIQELYIRFFYACDPSLKDEPKLTEGFAKEVARLTRVWSKNHRDNPAAVDRAGARLHRWIVKNV